ncbi:helix-turn-helix domain-containing protein [Duganella sp. P38]|uniref:helix-turn-helix domain-containing protein n=1 Tax=Duganella sp. P38 TaxID=3423949 RepID=UPI003D799467
MDASEKFDIEQAAARLFASRRVILALARSGALPACKVGPSWVFLRTDVLNFLRARIDADTQQRLAASSGTQSVAASAPKRPPGRPRTVLPVLPPVSPSTLVSKGARKRAG